MTTQTPHAGSPSRFPLVLLGVGLGALFDGIVLHQVLQWHHLVSTPVPPTTVESLELNTLFDGLFHVVGWSLAVAAIVLLWLTRADAPMSRRYLFGGLLLGWGLFNVVEGVVDHHLLELHHVRPGPDQALYDVGFLVWGAAMVAAGFVLLRSTRGTVAESRGSVRSRAHVDETGGTGRGERR